jgi:hypothetical protein
MALNWRNMKTCSLFERLKQTSIIGPSKSQSKLYYDRRSFGHSVLVSGTHLGPATNFPLFSLLIFRQLLVCWCGAPSLTRSRVCSFQYLLGIAIAVFLRSESHGTHEHILSLRLRFPQPGGPGSCIYFPQEVKLGEKVWVFIIGLCILLRVILT